MCYKTIKPFLVRGFKGNKPVPVLTVRIQRKFAIKQAFTDFQGCFLSIQLAEYNRAG